MENNSSSEKNRIILKNTLFMYGRMLVMLVISLFTARVVFNTLGIDDYGTYNVVGGIIVFFTFLNNGLSAATKRYITAEIAKGDERSTSHVFYVCLVAHAIIALFILLLAETVGLWVVNAVLNIPADRMYAANWVYQLSVVSAVLGIMQSPFGSVIVAYERMSIYAYFTIFDAVAKLLIIYMVQALQGDKLIVYALLIFGVSMVNMAIYCVYTYRSFPICCLRHRQSDRPLLKEIFSFMSWSLAGQAAVVGTNQGVSVLINVYHNVAVNAAMGVSNAITGVVNGFIANFQVAFNPQIVKSYVAQDHDYLQSLIVRASKLSSYLLIIFLVPLLFEAGNVLAIWLGNYPRYAVEFCVLTLVAIYFEAVSAPLWMVVYAQKDIKTYQVVLSSVYSLNFFLGWVVLLLGTAPYSVIIVRVFVFMALTAIRMYFTKRFFALFDVRRWLREVLLASLLIFAAASMVTGTVMAFVSCPRFVHIVLTTLISLSVTLPLVYLKGLTVHERAFVREKTLAAIHKFKH